MSSQVKMRPSHYDVLGLKPSANAAEIARAFAREMSRPRAFGTIADVSIAYETLRNPDKRRGYDESIGLGRVRPAEPRPKSLWAGSPYMLRAAAHAAEPMVPERAAAPVAPPPAEPRPFIAARLEELARPEPLRRPEPEQPQPGPQAVAGPDEQAADDSDEASPSWRRIALPVGGVVAAVALLGAWAGWRSDSGAARQPAEAAVMLSPPTTFTVDDAAAGKLLDKAAKPSPAIAAPPANRHRAAASAARPRTVRSRLSDIDKQLAPTAIEAAAPSEAASDAPAPNAVAASMPLPNAVVARTINRIGYPCGQVASTSASDGPGAFTVTCTSGHSYRAAPVRGRYHFRKLR